MTDNVTLPGTGVEINSFGITDADNAPQRQIVSVGDMAGSSNDVIGPINETAPSTDTAPAGLNGRLQRIAGNISATITALNTGFGSVVAELVSGFAANTAALVTGFGNVVTSVTALAALFPTTLTKTGNLRVGGTTTTPISNLPRPANTTPYAQGQLIANSTVAGSVNAPNIVVAGGQGGSGVVRRGRLFMSAPSGGAGVAIQVDLWTNKPTFVNGDGGAYAVATGSALWVGSMTFTNMIQTGDGAYGAAVPDVGSELAFNALPDATGTKIYWTMKVANATGFTPTSAEIFTLQLDTYPD